MRGVLAAETGTPTMVEIALAIQEGAMAYLKRQFKTIAVILIPLAIVVFVTSTEIVKPVLYDGAKLTYGSEGLTFAQSACSARSRSSPAVCCRASPDSSG